YAPRPPRRLRRTKRLVALVLVLAILGGIGFLGYRWSQQQYFVAAEDGKVAIFRGIQTDLPLVTLQHVESVSDVELTALTDFEARQVREGITASSLEDARQVVADLEEQAGPTPSPSPSRTPSSDSSSAAPTRWSR
ncbi:MAG: BofC C-terminal domain-containing protein, partial [Aeromicrobium erythreum]